MEEPSLIPIDTEYKGYYFRSRLEARYAVLFDKLGWDWRYEEEGYQLKSGWYLPDFYFPEFNMYGEVKPNEITGYDLQRCMDLSIEVNRPEEPSVILFEGEFGFKAYRTLMNGVFSCEVVPLQRGVRYFPFYYTAYFEKHQFPETYMAMKHAKGARFEFEWKEF